MNLVAKGKRFERQIRKQLDRIGEGKAKRTARSGAYNHDGDVIDPNPEYAHECKHQNTLSLSTWWTQTRSQARPGQTPILHFTSDYRASYTVMSEKDFKGYLNNEQHARFWNTILIRDIKSRLSLTKFYATISERVDYYNAVYRKEINDEDCIIMPTDFYINMRKELLSDYKT